MAIRRTANIEKADWQPLPFECLVKSRNRFCDEGLSELLELFQACLVLFCSRTGGMTCRKQEASIASQPTWPGAFSCFEFKSAWMRLARAHGPGWFFVSVGLSVPADPNLEGISAFQTINLSRS